MKSFVPISGSEIAFIREAGYVGVPEPEERISFGIYITDEGNMEKVVQFACQAGFEVLEAAPVHKMVLVRGSIRDINSAFNIELGLFQHGGEVFRGYTGTVSILDGLGDSVSGVFGLFDYPIFKPSSIIDTLGVYKAMLNSAVLNKIGSSFPTQVAKAYNFPGDASGKGQTIGIIELGGGYRQSSLEKYFASDLKIEPPRILDVSVNGGKNNPGKSIMNDIEVHMNIEIIGAIARDAQIVVYFAPDATELSFLRAIQQAVYDKNYNNSVISISWGTDESMWHKGFMDAVNRIFFEASLRGITVCVASGNTNSSSRVGGAAGSVDFPAASPYVLACGGTKMNMKDGIIENEEAWNDFDGLLDKLGRIIPKIKKLPHTTKYGASAIFAMPKYQRDAGISPQSLGPDRKNGRTVPDVASNASILSGYKIRVGDILLPIGGTSSAAPLWAALIALLNEKLGKHLGYINPLLYKVARLPGVFNPTIETDNGGSGSDCGWNQYTGLGTPNGKKLLDALMENKPGQ